MDEFIENIRWQRSPNGALGLFKIHSCLTVALLMFLSLSVFCLQIFTEPIQCTNDGPKQNDKAINNYCWSKTTFEVPYSRYTQQHLDELPTSRMNRLNQEKDSNAKTYRSYYRFTWLALLIQACLCRLPNTLWKYLESKLLRTEASHLTGSERMTIMLTYIMNNAKVNYCICEHLKKLILGFNITLL